MEDKVFTPMQNEILRAVFRSMDKELGIKPLTDEQIKAFNIRLDEVANEADKQIQHTNYLSECLKTPYL